MGALNLNANQNGFNNIGIGYANFYEGTWAGDDNIAL